MVVWVLLNLQSGFEGVQYVRYQLHRGNTDGAHPGLRKPNQRLYAVKLVLLQLSVARTGISS